MNYSLEEVTTYDVLTEKEQEIISPEMFKLLKDFDLNKGLSDLNKFKMINNCESTEELKAAILLLGDKDGYIPGRKHIFTAKKLAEKVDLIFEGKLPYNHLTREFGIRQQLMYIKYYYEK